jgi:hypothetical protein
MRELSTNLGAAAWKGKDSASGQAIYGTVQTTGNNFEVNAYRSELQGIHAKLLAISAVCSKIAEGVITLGCDNNKGGVTRSNGDWLKVNQNTRHADRIRAIRRLKDTSLPIQVSFVHIGGHQDDTTAFQELPRLAQLNVEMDYNTKARLRSLIAASSPPLRDAKLRYEGWHCTIDGAKIPPILHILFTKLSVLHNSGPTFMTANCFPHLPLMTWTGLPSNLPLIPFPPLSPLDVKTR